MQHLVKLKEPSAELPGRREGIAFVLFAALICLERSRQPKSKERGQVVWSGAQQQ
jgi:hypothetical protein